MANRYWVGNGGTYNLSDTTHWSTTSGGAGGASVPTIGDNPIFDVNSFTLPNQSVTTVNTAGDYDLSFTTMNWTGVLNIPTFNISDGPNFRIHGSLIFVSTMNLICGGFPLFEFLSTSVGNIVDFGTLDLTNVLSSEFTEIDFNGVGGGWTINNILNGNSYIGHAKGSLITNSNIINCSAFDSGFSNTRSLTLGSSTINCVYYPDLNAGQGLGASFDIAGSGLTFDKGTAIINILSSVDTNFNSYIAMNSGNTLNRININIIGQFEIDTDCSFDNFTINKEASIAVKADTTQTFTNSPQISGSVGNIIAISNLTPGTFTFSKLSGIISCNYISLINCIASGGATFFAGENSIDNGGNTGWIFSGPLGFNAKHDENSIPTMTGVLNQTGSTVFLVEANPLDHGLSVSNSTTGSNNGPTNALKDGNDISTLLAVSKDDETVLVPIYIDISGNLLIDSQ